MSLYVKYGYSIYFPCDVYIFLHFVLYRPPTPHIYNKHMNCLLEAVASVWIRTLHTLNSKSLENDLTTSAQQQLRDALSFMQRQLARHDAELSDITALVKRERYSMPRERLKGLLLKSKRVRASQEQVLSKMALMESQLDAMENNEMNKTILYTLQTSAKAMKKMGLDKDLRKTDDVINELEENMQHAHDINHTVSNSMNQFDTTDDEALERELDILLGIHAEPTRIPQRNTNGALPQMQAPNTMTDGPGPKSVATSAPQTNINSAISNGCNNTNNDDPPSPPDTQMCETVTNTQLAPAIQWMNSTKARPGMIIHQNVRHPEHTSVMILPSFPDVPKTPVILHSSRIQQIEYDESEGAMAST